MGKTEISQHPAIDCAECLEFQLDLAHSALGFYQGKRKDTKVLQVGKVLGACFLNSWARYPSSKFGVTNKCHMSFSARGKGNDSPIWFFAELVEVNHGEFRTTRCEILNPSCNGTIYGCGFCPCDKTFPHPAPQEGSRISMKHPERIYSYRNMAANYKHNHRPDKSLSMIEAAKIALRYHEMDSVYEIHEVLFFEKNFFWVEVEGTSLWYHVGFTAAAKPGDSDTSPKCFFGELKFYEVGREFVPTCCMILNANDSGLRRGCGFCPGGERYFHPSSGYRCGFWEEVPMLEFTDDSDHDDCMLGLTDSQLIELQLSDDFGL